MNKHELEARLKQVRKEIDSINREGNEMKVELIRRAEERKAAEEEKAKARDAALKRQRSTFWGRTLDAFGFRDPAAKTEGGLEFLFSATETMFSSAAGANKVIGMDERRTALEMEEGRILDELAALSPVNRDLTKAEQREKIYDEMAQRRKEWERVTSHESDEERLRRLQNLFDEAEARDEEKLRKLL